MKRSEIKIFGRAAMVGRQGMGAAITLALTAGLALWGFLTASLRLLMSAGEIDRTLRSVSSFLSPAANAAACLLLLLAGLAAGAPMIMGVNEWLILGAMEKGGGRASPFRWYRPSLAVRSFTLTLTLALIRLGLAVFFCLPGAALIGGGCYLLFTSGAALNILLLLFSGGGVITVIGALFAFCAAQAFAAAPYIVARLPDTSVRSAVEASMKIMQGRCLAFASFKLSFIPWWLCCLLIVPTLFVWPYYRQACAVWVVEAIKLTPSPSEGKSASK